MAVFKTCNVMSGFVNDAAVYRLRIAVQNELVRQQDRAGAVFAPPMSSSRFFKVRNSHIARQPITLDEINRTQHR